MSICTITATFLNSGGFVLPGTLRITLDAPITIDGTLYTLEPQLYSIDPTTGSVSFDLYESETSQVTYHIQCYRETDLALDFENLNPLNGYDFHAIVPNQSTASLDDLMPVPLMTDILPSGIRKIAQIIATTPEYSANLQYVQPRGVYDNSAVYVSGDLVTFDGGSFIWVNSVQGNSIPPLETNADWQVISLRGEPGSGVGGIDEPFDAALWQGKLEPPSRNSLSGVIIDRNNPMAYPGHLAGVPVSGISDEAIPTNVYLKENFAQLDSPALTGTPTAVTQPVPDPSNSIATGQHVLNAIKVSGYEPIIGEVKHCIVNTNDNLYTDQRGFKYYQPDGTPLGSASSAAIIKDDRLEAFFKLLVDMGFLNTSGWNLLTSAGGSVSLASQVGVRTSQQLWDEGYSIVPPNMTGRTIKGIAKNAPVGISSNILGQRVGTETKALTTSHLPSHNHTIPGHTHTISNHTHAVGNHTHSISSHTHTMPTHRHSMNHGHGNQSPVGHVGTSSAFAYTFSSGNVRWEAGHTIINNYSGYTGYTDPGNTHGSGTLTTNSRGAQTTTGSGTLTTNNSGTLTTNNNGNGSSFSIEQPSIALTMLIYTGVRD